MFRLIDFQENWCSYTIDVNSTGTIVDGIYVRIGTDYWISIVCIDCIFVAYVISGFKYPFSEATFTNIIYIVVYICKLVLGHCYTHKRDFPKCPYNTKDLTIDKPQKGKR